MAGRDAYLELGYHQPAANPNPEPVQAPLDASNHMMAAMENSPQITLQSPQTHEPLESSSGDYIAGLSVLLLVLLVGLAAGYFGRDLFANNSASISELSVLDPQPNATDTLASSGTSANVAFIGSDASDQVLAIEPTGDGDALMMVKSYAGIVANGSETRVLRYNASDANGEGLGATELASLKGEGLHMARLGDGALMAVTLDKETLLVSRLNDNGRTVWTESFGTSALDRSEVAIAADAASLIVLAPSETRQMTQLVAIKSDGIVKWQNSFDRPRSWQTPFVSVDQNGQTYALLGTDAEGQAMGDQTVATVDADGRILRKRRVTLGSEDVVSGLAARPEGGVTLFVSGEFPRLVQFDSFGQRLTSTDLPYMQYLNDARLIEAENGDVLIASTYALMGNRVELMLEQRTTTGAAHGQSSFSMPEGATLDGLVQIGEGEYLISGSVRRERYLPTDVFVQRIAFTPGTPVLPADTSLANLTEDGMATSMATLDFAEVTENEPALAATAEDAPIPMIASLTVAPVETEAIEELPTITGTEAEAVSPIVIEPDQSASVIAEETDPIVQSEMEPELEEALIDDELFVDQPVIFLRGRSDDLQDVNSAAISRFIDQSIVTQCRFTCMDRASGSTFPMTGHFLPAVLGTAKDVDNVHTGVCRSADLAPALDTKPVCGIN